MRADDKDSPSTGWPRVGWEREADPAVDHEVSSNETTCEGLCRIRLCRSELDAVEDNYGANYLTWHYASCNSQATSSTISTGPWQYDCKTNAPAPRTRNITAPSWNIVDIAFTATGFSVYYNGKLFDSIKENVTTSGKDPMWLTVSESSCKQPSFNACAKGISGGPGNVQVRYIRVFR